MSLSREDVLAVASAGIESRIVDIPAWGGPVRLRAMPLGERLEFTRYAEAQRVGGDAVSAITNAWFRLVFVSLIDDAGVRLFAEGEEHLLAGFDFAGFAAAREAAQELNGMKPAPPEQGEDSPPLAD